MRSSGTEQHDGRPRSSTVTWSKVVVGASLLLTVAFASLGAMAASTTTTTAPSESTDTTAAPTTESTEAQTTTAAPAATTATTAGGATESTDTTSAETTTTLSAEAKQEKARAVANLNLAKAADVEIAAELQAINEKANVTLERIEAATKRIEDAQLIAERSKTELAESDNNQQDIESALMLKAVEGFKSRSVGGPGSLLGEAPVNQTIRQNQLLDEASASTTELLEELRGLLEDRRSANTEAQRAEADAKAAERELQAELEKLKEQQNAQLGLKAEAERRVDQWAAELTAYAREDAGIQKLIGENAAPAVVNNAINNPTTPSALGFQWPLEGASVTSEYGYRIHPVYGTRRLHAGIDMGAGRGTPIASSNDGVVIFVGTRGGYGRTVLVDHGNGITTLYAHMSEAGVFDGQAVSRGDILGFVGATGTATGNHLHFEVRVNGGPVNPRNYLP